MNFLTFFYPLPFLICLGICVILFFIIRKKQTIDIPDIEDIPLLTQATQQELEGKLVYIETKDAHEMDEREKYWVFGIKNNFKKPKFYKEKITQV